MPCTLRRPQRQCRFQYGSHQTYMPSRSFQNQDIRFRSSSDRRPVQNRRKEQSLAPVYSYLFFATSHVPAHRTTAFLRSCAPASCPIMAPIAAATGEPPTGQTEIGASPFTTCSRRSVTARVTTAAAVVAWQRFTDLRLALVHFHIKLLSGNSKENTNQRPVPPTIRVAAKIPFISSSLLDHSRKIP